MFCTTLTNCVREKQLGLFIYPNLLYGLGMEKRLEFYQTTPPLQSDRKQKNHPPMSLSITSYLLNCLVQLKMLRASTIFFNVIKFHTTYGGSIFKKVY